ncbi:MAG TPA: hypothetical protein DEB06_04470 [Phycisphaerales bacterium]|nr:hypothetical protein [Phycisphaerales bacterium]
MHPAPAPELAGPWEVRALVGTLAPLCWLALTRTDWWSVGLLAAGAALFALPAIRRIVRRRLTPGAAPESVQARASQFARLSDERRELEALMSDVRELTRLCAAQIDARTAKLERLVERAEGVASRLEGAPARTGSARIESRRVTPSSGEPPPDPLAERVYALADAGRSPVEIASELSEHVGKVELVLALRA